MTYASVTNDVMKKLYNCDVVVYVCSSMFYSLNKDCRTERTWLSRLADLKNARKKNYAMALMCRNRDRAKWIVSLRRTMMSEPPDKVKVAGKEPDPGLDSKKSSAPPELAEAFIASRRILDQQRILLTSKLQSTQASIVDRVGSIRTAIAGLGQSAGLNANEQQQEWYSAKVSFWMKRYENFIGLTEVKSAQVRVVQVRIATSTL